MGAGASAVAYQNGAKELLLTTNPELNALNSQQLRYAVSEPSRALMPGFRAVSHRDETETQLLTTGGIVIPCRTSTWLNSQMQN